MSCNECDKVQDIAFDKNDPNTTNIYYVRIGNANVAIVACYEHAKQIIEQVRVIKKERQEHEVINKLKALEWHMEWNGIKLIRKSAIQEIIDEFEVKE